MLVIELAPDQIAKLAVPASWISAGVSHTLEEFKDKLLTLGLQHLLVPQFFPAHSPISRSQTPTAPHPSPCRSPPSGSLPPGCRLLSKDREEGRWTSINLVF